MERGSDDLVPSLGEAGSREGCCWPQAAGGRRVGAGGSTGQPPRDFVTFGSQQRSSSRRRASDRIPPCASHHVPHRGRRIANRRANGACGSSCCAAQKLDRASKLMLNAVAPHIHLVGVASPPDTARIPC